MFLELAALNGEGAIAPKPIRVSSCKVLLQVFVKPGFKNPLGGIWFPNMCYKVGPKSPVITGVK